jgi:RNA polymerase sigma factor (TIGR02999 family)
MSDVTQLLEAAAAGDPKAAAELLPLVYDELRRLAAARLATEKPGQTLQPTALVHEAFLRLVGSQPEQEWNGRGHFFAAAAEAMRRILVDHARRFACGTEDGTVRVWEVPSAKPVGVVELGKELIAFKAHTGRVSALSFGGDGARLANAGADGAVKVWEAATGRELVKCAHRTGASAVALSPDGTRIATGAGSGEVTLWDAATGERTFKTEGDKTANNLATISGLTFSPDGTRLLIGGATTVKVWDARPAPKP